MTVAERPWHGGDDRHVFIGGACCCGESEPHRYAPPDPYRGAMERRREAALDARDYDRRTPRR